MQILLATWRRGMVLAGVGVLLAVSGCRPAAQTNDLQTSVAQDKRSGKASVTGASSVTPQPIATMTVTQAMGVGVLKALNADPGMKGHKISVGTGPGTVWLNGSVAKPQQRALATKIAQKQIPNAKIVSELTVGARP